MRRGRSSNRAICLTTQALLVWLALTTAALGQTPDAEYARLSALQQQAPAPALTEGSGVTARDIELNSKLLGKTMRYRILLPAGYGQSHRYYPVLYLLHGYMNPYYEWDKQTQLAELLQQHAMIVVMPQFDNSFYLNAAGNEKAKYESYFFRELLPDVESHFRARTEPPARAIGGVSMGGYGAILWALHWPHAFSFAGSFSGCLAMAKDEQLAEGLKPFDINAILGSGDSETRQRADLFALVEKADPATLPPLWLTAGTEDFLYPQNLDFLAAARAKKIALEFHTAPGSHEWDYWRKDLPQFLDAVERAFAAD